MKTNAQNPIESGRLKTGLNVVIPWLLGLLTLIVLLTNLPDTAAIGDYAPQALIYAFVTVLALYFNVRLSRYEVSPVHVVGMLALLSQPAQAFGVTLWAIFTGAVVGTAIRWLLPGVQRLQIGHLVSSAAFIAARATLSFYVAGQFYLAVDGPLPLQQALWNQPETIVALALYSVLYVTLYFLILVLELYARGMALAGFLRVNWLLMLVVLCLPIPFTILSSELAGRQGSASEFMGVLALVTVIMGLHFLSRSEQQLRRQLDEMQLLAAASRQMRSNMALDELLQLLHIQASTLMGGDHFTVALTDPEPGTLQVRMTVRDGERQPVSGEAVRDDDLIAHVYHTSSPLLIASDVPGTAHRMGLIPPRGAIYSWMGAPLLVGERRLGVMAIASSERRFNNGDLRMLNILASSASIALENAQLYQQQAQRVEHLATLNRIGSQLSGTLSPNTVLDTIVSSASELAQASGVALFLFWVDDDDEALSLMRSAGLSSRFVEQPPAPLLLDGGWNHVPERPLVIGDAAQDSRLAGVLPRLRDERIHAMVELPLVIGQSNLGVLALYYDRVRDFSDEQVELLRTLANQAAQAIDNARIFTSTDEAFQRSVEQLLALTGIGQMLASTVDLKSIGNLVLEHAMEATRSDIGAVVIYDEARDRYQVLASYGYPEGVLEQPEVLVDSLGGDTLRLATFRQIDDVTQEPRYRQFVDSMRSQISMPILRGEVPRGYITLESSRPAAYSAEDAQFLAQISNQAVVAIDNARHFASVTEARDRMQVILNTMDEAVLLVDREDNVVLASPRVALIGLDSAALIDRSLDSLLADPDMRLAERLGFASGSAVRQALHAALNGHEDGAAPHLYVVQEGAETRYVERLAIPVRGKQRQIAGVLLVFYNKTQQQELERARQELTRMIVHDLRSPLTAVTTSLRLLQDVVTESSEHYSLVQTTTETSRRAVRKLLSRVDSMLDISKMQSGRMNIDADLALLQHLAESVRGELEPLAHELDIIIDIQIGDEVPLISVDADKVERLLMNLADNALKYSPTSSRMIIRAFPPEADEEPPGFVRVEVVDNGPGIPDDYKSNLFDAFLQVEGRPRVRRGVGLGLAFCKLVTEAHGGRIWIEDNPDGGSIFVFTLPAAGMRSPRERDGESPSDSNGDRAED